VTAFRRVIRQRALLKKVFENGIVPLVGFNVKALEDWWRKVLLNGFPKYCCEDWGYLRLVVFNYFKLLTTSVMHQGES
jgi:hypothetical protein